jgi:heat shock protein HslJ
MCQKIIALACLILSSACACNKSGSCSKNNDALKSSNDYLIRSWNNGVEFVAHSPDSSWTLDLDFDKTFVFKTNNKTYSAKAVVAKYAPDSSLYQFNATTSEGDISITIYPHASTYKLEHGFFHKVEISLKNNPNHFSGVGRYIPNPSLNNIWVLDSLDGIKFEKDSFLTQQPQIEFHNHESKIIGTDGCNRINGLFEAKQNRLETHKMASTLMYCPSPLLDDFQYILNHKNLTYKFENGNLYLITDKGRRLVFKHVD